MRLDELAAFLPRPMSSIMNFETRLHAGDAVAQVVGPRAGDGGEDLVRLLLRDEHADARARGAEPTRAAADEDGESSRPSCTAPTSETQLISGALHRSLHAAIGYLCLRGRLAKSGFP